MARISSGGTPAEKNPDYADTAVPDAPAPPESGANEHSHTPCQENNIVEHEEAGYCGNTGRCFIVYGLLFESL